MNNENNIYSNLPTDLKVQLEILATENHMSIDNLIEKVLTTYVESEFSDYDNIVE